MIWSESQSGQRMKGTRLKKDYDSKFCPFILLMRALPYQKSIDQPHCIRTDQDLPTEFHSPVPQLAHRPRQTVITQDLGILYRRIAIRPMKSPDPGGVRPMRRLGRTPDETVWHNPVRPRVRIRPRPQTYCLIRTVDNLAEMESSLSSDARGEAWPQWHDRHHRVRG